MADKPKTPMAYLRDELFTPYGETLGDVKAFKDANPAEYAELRDYAEAELAQLQD